MNIHKQLKKTKAIILDMDGVLVDTEHLHMKAFEIFLNQFTITVDQDFLRSLIGTSIEDNLKMFSRRFPEFRGKNIGDMVNARNEIYLDLLHKEQLVPMSGVIELLDFCLNNNIKTGLASSSDQEQIDTIIQNLNSNKDYELNLNQSFHSIVAGDSVSQKKPAPDIYLQSLKNLGIDKQHVVAVEDSQAGLTSAKNAGIFCFALENPYNNVYRMQGTDYILKTLYDLTELLFEV